ncbi:MAG: NAD(P)-dependent oxidoreductase [Leptolyngbyaceae cyanobacterium]
MMTRNSILIAGAYNVVGRQVATSIRHGYTTPVYRFNTPNQFTMPQSTGANTGARVSHSENIPSGLSFNRSQPLPRHVAIIGAAGGLGQALLTLCREAGIEFTAIVRSRPERITDIPPGSRVAVVSSLADRSALTAAFAGADAVITALGVTSTSQEPSALLSENMATVEQAMLAAGIKRVVLINTLLSSSPGKPANLAMRFFSLFPGIMGRGATEQQAVVDALGRGEFSSLQWTLVRGGLNARGKDDVPVASSTWANALNSWMPVSYRSMAQWILEEVSMGRFIQAAPLVSRRCQ